MSYESDSDQDTTINSEKLDSEAQAKYNYEETGKLVP
jgi:hypothetical protein